MKGSINSGNKKTFGNRKKGKAVKRPNKHHSSKVSRGQG